MHSRRSVDFFGNVLDTAPASTCCQMLIKFCAGICLLSGRAVISALPSTPLSEPLVGVALRESSFKPGLISFEGSHDRANSDLRNIEADLFYISKLVAAARRQIILLTFFSPKHRVSHGLRRALEIEDIANAGIIGWSSEMLKAGHMPDECATGVCRLFRRRRSAVKRAALAPRSLKDLA